MPKISSTYNLKTLNPKLAKEWHPEKNNELTPQTVTPNKNIKPWWKCNKGHEWQNWLPDRNKGQGKCPYCNHKIAYEEYNLTTEHPELVDEWDTEKNSPLVPYDFTPKSRKKVWWICANGHSWLAAIYSRSNGNGCRICSGRVASSVHNFKLKNPDLAKQWHPERNKDLKPDQITPNSHIKIWWICDKGHEYEMDALHRNAGNGCPYCAGKRVGKDNNLFVLFPEVAKSWNNLELLP